MGEVERLEDKNKIMKLPNCNNAFIPQVKLIEYLLSETHPVGKSKAKFFRSLGYSKSNVDLLEEGILTIARTNPVKDVIPTPYGTKYTIEGFLGTPNKTSVKLLTVWVIEPEVNEPRFVTAYPA